MIKEIRAWREGKVALRQLYFENSSFYGPFIMVIERRVMISEKKLALANLEIVTSSYKCEDASVGIGINSLVKKFAKEYSMENGNIPFSIETRFGKSIIINSEDVDEAFEEFVKQIILF